MSATLLRFLILIPLTILLAVGSVATAAAQSCSVTVSALNFGSIDVTQNTTFTTSSTLNISCSGLSSYTVLACIGFGGGTGGINGSGNPRYMSNGANTLSYEIYKDAAHTTVWGSDWTGSGGTKAQFNVPLNGSGNGSMSVPVYGLVFASQRSVATGSYLSSFTTGDVNLQLSYVPSGCGSYYTPPTFNVTATVIPACTVSATNLSFGSAGLLTSNVDATSIVSVTCSNAAPYNVGLSAGSGTGATVAARKMSSGGSTITYSLYQNSARTTVWGTTIGTDTETGTGTGSAQNLTVYGRVPPQTTPAPGAYSDTIIVTVTY